MSLAFKQIKVYTKVALVLVVAMAIGAIFWKNRGHYVRFWFFGVVDSQQEINVVWLILCTAVGSILSWWVLLTGVSLIRDVREVRRDQALRKREDDQRELAEKLREQEKRIDDKLKHAIGKDPEQDS
ncbi:MAG: hypothetical protein ACYSUI_16100 [Planctomycetota bacterium]|jgi:uncharacterized membrane protein YccC